MWFRGSRLASEPGEENGRSEPAFAVQLVDLINKTENFAGFDVIPISRSATAIAGGNLVAVSDL
jgi:hypothetical protein